MLSIDCNQSNELNCVFWNVLIAYCAILQIQNYKYNFLFLSDNRWLRQSH